MIFQGIGLSWDGCFFIYIYIYIYTSSPFAGITGEQCYEVLGKEDEQFHPVMFTLKMVV